MSNRLIEVRIKNGCASVTDGSRAINFDSFPDANSAAAYRALGMFGWELGVVLKDLALAPGWTTGVYMFIVEGY